MKSTEPKRKISGKAESWVSIENARSTDADDRQDHIATAAYYKAEARGFLPGLEIDDWVAAETELNKSAVF
jgi:hypothetical protein